MNRRLTRTALAFAGLLAGLAARVSAALPEEITVTALAKLELQSQRTGKPAGSIGLKPGDKLTVIDAAGEFVVVRFRNLNGRVLAAKTDLPADELAAANAATSPAPSAGSENAAPLAGSTQTPAPTPAPVPAAKLPTPSATATAPAPASSYVPATAFERTLAGKLVRCENGALRAFEPERLAGVKFYALYFSASWCPPCREFTPGFVDAYGKIRALYPEFEVVLVNFDRSLGAMVSYMRDDHMQWPALRWDLVRDTRPITRYGGDGIPCLVLIDEAGNVLSDTYRGGTYVGPDPVLDDIWKILRDYRRQHPRPKA